MSLGDALDVLPEEPLDVDDILIDDCFRDIPAQSGSLCDLLLRIIIINGI